MIHHYTIRAFRLSLVVKVGNKSLLAGNKGQYSSRASLLCSLIPKLRENMASNYTPPQRKTKVVFVQLGSPKNPTTKEVRKYLRSFLGDPRVVDINPWVWKIILNCFVLPFRPKKSAQLYARIWDGESFPLITNTADFTEQVRNELTTLDPSGYVEVNHAFLLSPPYVHEVYDSWEQDLANGTGAT